jgi:hypothetical protein
MLQMGCPVGIIFTPEVLRIYKDQFRGRTEDSIELVGDFPSGELSKARQPAAAASAVESALVEWLDELAHTGRRAYKEHSMILQYIKVHPFFDPPPRRSPFCGLGAPRRV